MYNLFVVTGSERTGTGFTRMIFDLHPEITIANVPGWYDLGVNQDCFSLDRAFDYLHKIIIEGGSWHEFNHAKMFEVPYYQKVIEFLKQKEKKKNILGIWNKIALVHYNAFLQKVDCPRLIVYCCRDFIEQYKSYNVFFNNARAEEFVNHYIGNMWAHNNINDNRAEFVYINIFDEWNSVINKIDFILKNKFGLELSENQIDFLKERRKIGYTKKDKKSNKVALEELKATGKYEELNFFNELILSKV